jgi:hypothetical protein
MILRKMITYLENNRDRMKYPEYRRAGLPVTGLLDHTPLVVIDPDARGLLAELEPDEIPIHLLAIRLPVDVPISKPTLERRAIKDRANLLP